MRSDPTLAPFSALVGSWTTEATHPMTPGVVVHGTVVAEWLEGERFLSFRALTDHPEFPDSLWVIGDMDHDREGEGGKPLVATPTSLRIHCFDSRGVFRICETSIDAASWRVWRMAPGFSQRFTGRFSDGGHSISGTWELCRDDMHWADDLAITYRRS
jgi:hypothetical protein